VVDESDTSNDRKCNDASAQVQAATCQEDMQSTQTELCLSLSLSPYIYMCVYV